MPKQRKFEARRNLVVSNWGGSPFSYFQYLNQQLRSNNEMDNVFQFNFQQAFGFNETIDENSFNAQHPEIHRQYIQIEREETQNVEKKTPNSRKQATKLLRMESEQETEARNGHYFISRPNE